MERVYLDHNASSPLRPEARAAMLAAMDVCGNPSSIHAEGRAARAIVEGAREMVAAHFGVRAAQVVFTSGATEAANWVLSPDQSPKHVSRLFFGATEHACVVSGHRFQDSSRTVRVDSRGVADVDHLSELMAEVGEAPAMVSFQAASNETGVIQPLSAIGEICRSHNAVFVCDAVQAVGRMTGNDVDTADILFISAHKFGGPKGIGAVIFRNAAHATRPLLGGGGQERGFRAGTENVVAVAGLAVALEAASGNVGTFAPWASEARKKLEVGLRSIRPDVVIFGEDTPRIPNTTCFAAPGIPAEIALMALDIEGVAVSSGSACSSGKVAPSHVLAAMGVAPDLAKCAIRVCTGWTNTDADIERFLQVWEKIYTRLRPRAAA